MNGDDDESGALVPRSGGDLAKRSDALAKRACELTDPKHETVLSGKQTEAKRYFEEAWIEFGIGVENAINKRVLGDLIDAFDDGVKPRLLG